MRASCSLLFAAALLLADTHPGAQAQPPPAPTALGRPVAATNAKSSNAKPRPFAVASIRRNISGTETCDPEHLFVAADGFRMTNCPLIAALFIASVPADGSAFGFSTDGRTVGAPDWMKSEKYDIVAKVDQADLAAWQDPASQREMLHAMMQSLLAERCNLAAHREMRDKPVYALVTARNGPKFQAAKSLDSAAILANHPSAGAIPGGGGMFSSGSGGNMDLYGASIQTLAIVLSNKAGRPVVDKTGLTGRYDFKLEMPQMEPPAVDGDQEPRPFLRSSRSSLG